MRARVPRVCRRRSAAASSRQLACRRATIHHRPQVETRLASAYPDGPAQHRPPVWTVASHARTGRHPPAPTGMDGGHLRPHPPSPPRGGIATHTRGTRALIVNPAVPSAEARSDGAEGTAGTGITSSPQPWNGCLTAGGHPGMPQQAAALQGADYKRNILFSC